MDIELTRKQFVPLALLYASDDQQIKGRTRLLKLIFLLNEESDLDEEDKYDFRKYDYGPFSKEILDDLEWLEESGAVDIDRKPTFGGSTRYDHELTETGEELVEIITEIDQNTEVILEEAQAIVEEHNSKSIRSLLEYVYEEYPEYTENSVYQY